VGRRPGRPAGLAAPGGPALSLLLLDTTFLVDAERAGGFFDDLIEDDDQVAVAALTIAELAAGVHLAEGRRRVARRRFVLQVLEEVPIVPYDLTVAAAHGELLAATRRAGRSRGAHDLIIAATARATRRTVITADPGAFADLPGVSWRSRR
jgi:tRNA(fMet)-specific endonuclease VapC